MQALRTVPPLILALSSAFFSGCGAPSGHQLTSVTLSPSKATAQRAAVQFVATGLQLGTLHSDAARRDLGDHDRAATAGHNYAERAGRVHEGGVRNDDRRGLGDGAFNGSRVRLPGFRWTTVLQQHRGIGAADLPVKWARHWSGPCICVPRPSRRIVGSWFGWHPLHDGGAALETT
jgi:hypothetical protein